MRVFLFIGAVFPALLFSVPPLKEAMLSDFEIIKNAYHVRYAPGDWKKQHCDWEADQAADEAVLLIKNMKQPSTKAYQHIVALFLQSMRDLHVKIQFYSTEGSMLPFTMRTAENRFFISKVHEKFVELYPDALNVGDEVLYIDDVPIVNCLEEMMVWKKFNPNSATDRALATRYLTFYSASHDFKVKQGEVKITVKRQNGEKEHLKMEWIYQPERVTNGYLAEAGKDEGGLSYNIEMSDPFYEEMSRLQNQLSKQEFGIKDEKLKIIGARKSFVPLLGELLWQSEPDAFFHAYLFETEDQRKVGYVRIHTFSPPSIKESDEKHKEVDELAALISYFEVHSEALVIDVVDHPGGAALFMYTFASMLTKEPLIPPKFRRTMTQQHIAKALEQVVELEEVQSDDKAREVLGETLQGYPVNKQLAQGLLNHSRFLIDEWNLGKRITDYDYLLGMSVITPYPLAQYTKPIVVLTNELSISCGDFFPAILQDNGRALIFGSKTAGAGGAVNMFSHPNYFGIAAYACTCSFGERVNREPIENLGCRPDILYEVTAEDLKGGYKGYAEALKGVVRRMVGGR